MNVAKYVDPLGFELRIPLPEKVQAIEEDFKAELFNRANFSA